MLNLHLSYKHTSSWRMLFLYGVYPSQFSRLENFRALVVPSGGFCEGIILQGIMTPTGVLPNGQSCLRIKGGVTGESVHLPRQSNSTYIQTFIQSIYKTRRPEHPQFPIDWYKQRPQIPASWPRYTRGIDSHSRPVSTIFTTPVIGQYLLYYLVMNIVPSTHCNQLKIVSRYRYIVALVVPP